MKKTLITIAAFAMLGVMVGCSTENTTEWQAPTAEAETVWTLHYTVDGTHYSATIHSEEDYDAFLHFLTALARGGRSVSFRDGRTTQNSSTSAKKVVTFTTTSESEAIAWSKQMANEGYEVTIDYDEKTGVFTCTATIP